MRIKKFSNWLPEMQLKIIHKHGQHCISEQVKSKKFLNHLPQYIKVILIAQIKEDWTHEYLVLQAEYHEALKKHIAVRTTTKGTPHWTSIKPDNANRNRFRNGWQHQKTGFKSSNNNSSNWPVKSYPTNYPDWDTITRNLDQKAKMELIRDKKFLGCCNKGHNYKYCRRR